MSSRKNNWLFIMACAAVSSAHATSIDQVNAQKLVKDAQLIFKGVVTKVEYRNSDVTSPTDVAVPHTFVTFAVNQTIKGNAASGNTITLRFEGGPDGKGNVMMVSGMPLFDVGDQDILFVQGNGKRPCPLVGWEQGRFHVVGGAVYSNEGQEVWLTNKGEFAFGPYHSDKEITKKTIGGQSFEFSNTETKGSWLPPAGAKPLTASSFTAFLAEKLGQTLTPQALALVPVVADADIRERFVAQGLKPKTPPAIGPSASAAQNSAGEFDPREEALKQQLGSDPVPDVRKN